MPTLLNPYALAGMAKMPPQLMQSSSAASEACLEAAQNLQLIQSNAGAEMLSRQLDSLALAFSPDGARYWGQQWPEIVQLQAQCLMKSAVDTWGELGRVQQALMAMSKQTLWQGVKASTDTVAKTFNKAYTRRVASQVIQFPDRRAA